MRIVIVFLLVALALSAQPTAPGSEGAPEIPEGVRKYLELTPEQTEALARLNASLSRFRSDKFNRTMALYAEIRQYTRAETLDPMAIGLRYVELESISRELVAEEKKTVSEAQKVLTASQRTRLTALEEVWKTHDTACGAVAIRVLTLPPEFARLCSWGYPSYQVSNVDQPGDAAPGLRD